VLLWCQRGQMWWLALLLLWLVLLWWVQALLLLWLVLLWFLLELLYSLKQEFLLRVQTSMDTSRSANRSLQSC